MNIIRKWEEQGMSIDDYRLLNKLRAVVVTSVLKREEKQKANEILNDLEMIAEGEE